MCITNGSTGVLVCNDNLQQRATMKPPQFNKPSAIALSSLALTLTVLLDIEIPYYTMLMLYVIVVAFCANYVGGSFTFFFSVVAAFGRTSVQALHYGSFPDLAVWMFFNVLCAYLLISFLIVKKNNLLDQLEKTSLTDTLTSLPNRRAFNNRLEQAVSHAKRYGEKLSIAYLDVDGFKGVNDTMGHHRGDDLLSLIAETMMKDLRSDDLPARLGGDEFAIIYAHKNGDGMVPRLKAELDMAVRENGFPVSFSIGVINYFGDKEVSSDDLVKYADELMYEVKRGTKNAICTKDYARAYVTNEMRAHAHV